MMMIAFTINANERKRLEKLFFSLENALDACIHKRSMSFLPIIMLLRFRHKPSFPFNWDEAQSYTEVIVYLTVTYFNSKWY